MLSALFFVKIALAIQSVLKFNINYGLICSNSLKNVIGILIGILPAFPDHRYHASSLLSFYYEFVL